MRKAATQMEPARYLPVMPVCLILDQIPIPDDYQAPAWAVDLVAEWRAEERLVQAKAYPTLSVLLTGPSGGGKTTAARWIAKQLGMPVFSLLLSGAIDSFLGATGKMLQTAFRFAIESRGLLLLDEIDAIAASREAKANDVGEIWRITNSFIQTLDHWHGDRRKSLMIATTNMADSIDTAIRRRFELEVSIQFPTPVELSKMAGVALPNNVTISYATLRKVMLQARRLEVMRGLDYRLTLLSLIAVGNS